MEFLEHYTDIAQALYNLSCDMDLCDYEEQEEIELEQLENALADLYTIAKNQYNKDHWRTLWRALENLVNY